MILQCNEPLVCRMYASCRYLQVVAGMRVLGMWQGRSQSVVQMRGVWSLTPCMCGAAPAALGAPVHRVDDAVRVQAGAGDRLPVCGIATGGWASVRMRLMCKQGVMKGNVAWSAERGLHSPLQARHCVCSDRTQGIRNMDHVSDGPDKGCPVAFPAAQLCNASSP